MFKEPKFAIKSQTDFREYYSGKLIKQKQQSSKRTEERSRIFDGCVCYVNGFSTGKYSAHFIGNLIAENGGVFEIVGRSTKVTHWVCDSIPDGKVFCLLIVYTLNTNHELRLIRRSLRREGKLDIMSCQNGSLILLQVINGFQKVNM